MQHSSSPQAMPLSPPPPPPNFPLSLPSLSGKKKEERWEQSNKRRKSSHNPSMLRWTKARYTCDCTFYNMLIILSMYACVHAHTHTHTHTHNTCTHTHTHTRTHAHTEISQEFGSPSQPDHTLHNCLQPFSYCCDRSCCTLLITNKEIKIIGL